MIAENISTYVYDRRFIYQSLATLTTFLAIKLVRFIRRRQRRFQLFSYYGIPTPETSIFSGNMETLKSNPARYQVDVQFSKRYGKVYGFFIGDEPNLVITDLELLRRVFFDENQSFSKRSRLFVHTPLSLGILFAELPRWKFMRKALSPYFGKYTMRGGSSTEFIEDSIRLMINYIDDRIDESRALGKRFEIDIQDLMKATALHLISEMAIKLPNVRVKENEENVISLDSYLSGTDKGVVFLAIKYPFLTPLIEFLAEHVEHNNALALVHQGVNKVIDETLAKLSKTGGLNDNRVQEQQAQAIDLLIKLHHEGKLTRREVMGNVESILFAGYDTTSTTLTYVFWVLGKYSKIQEKLRSELMAHGIESKYLNQVINETMRLYPTVITFTTRLASQTVDLGNLVIPEGTRVIYNHWLMFRNPEYWVDPDKFDPDRFHEGANIHPCAFAPFGLGARKCLGYQLALLEMRMIVCDILLRYRIKLRSPLELEIISYATSLSKPREKVMIELERL